MTLPSLINFEYFQSSLVFIKNKICRGAMFEIHKNEMNYYINFLILCK